MASAPRFTARACDTQAHQTPYQHVLPGMQADAATTFQQLIKPK